MHPHEQIRELRVQLFSMLRLSQRALDNSIKGYRLGQLDFSRHARNNELELELQYDKINNLCRRLIGERTLDFCDFRFALVALRISRSLQTIYNLTTQIAQDTIIYLKSNGATRCATLDRLGDRVNALLRLCVVALFNEDTTHARAVLQSEGVWRRYEVVFDSSYEAPDECRAIFEAAAVRNLGLIARQAHEIADAILFWLDEREDQPPFDSNEYRAFNALLASAKLV